MSIECGHCGRDMRGAHARDCPRATLTPLKRRIVDALRGRGEVSYWELARSLWPPKEQPRAWRHATKGGPHGWAMPLGKALGELERAGIVRDQLQTVDRPERTVKLTPANLDMSGPPGGSAR